MVVTHTMHRILMNTNLVPSEDKTILLQIPKLRDPGNSHMSGKPGGAGAVPNIADNETGTVG